ncbi:MAG: D-alanyl-D-alanine carboxypeptidase [Dorea sp.]|nr:D-alanyl-D-alanine carboxypeptidase [Dorea sp.]
MKCTDNSRRRKMRVRRRRRQLLIRTMTVVLLGLCTAAGVLFYKGSTKEEHLAADYEAGHYNTSLYRGTLFAADLCVASRDVEFEGGPDASTFKSAALFDVDAGETDYAYSVHEQLFPASVTKIMTALLALEYGNLQDMVTVNVDASEFAADEVTVGLKKGDSLTLEALVNGLLLHSGNDNANAIAEHIGGSIEVFVDMMNEKAAQLKATHTHFANPSGLHDDNHYTTAYDIYLIFNECVKNEEFVKIINTDSYTADIKGADGTTRQIVSEPSHFYAHGKATLPTTAEIIGGKTGTTKKAGNCLILLNKTADDKPYISVVMGAETKDLLYQDMTDLINGIETS